MNETVIKALIDLRWAVGYLGEKSQYNWWDTDFLSETGIEFLAINFPRSAFSAGVNSVTEAAKRLHDARIGKGGVYHLFRLPTQMEETIHKQLLPMPTATINSREAAHEVLNRHASDTAGAPEGPVQVGTLKDLASGNAIKEFAMHYSDAFGRGKLCFPYLKAN
jgi:hypothetical protein